MSRSGVKGFLRERLDQVLAARRLAQWQLAAMVGVSPATISKWRAGSNMPEREALERLASVVNVAPDWFTRPLSARGNPAPMFRSNAAALVGARSMLRARLEWAEDIVEALMEFVEFPELNLPECSFAGPEAITDEDIETAAGACRDLWRLGRSVIQDLALAAEGAGLILVREETGVPQIEGLSYWSSGLRRPFVLLSADKDNGYRSRFDLAHEIGHLVLHRNVDRVTDHERYKLMERQAHRFAGALLLPAETFAKDVRLPPTLDDLLLLKRRWGVSAAAIIMRLRALRMMGEEEALLLFKRRSVRWGAKSEPGDGDRVPERPRLLRRSIEMLAGCKIMPFESVPRHFGLSATDVEMLAGFPQGYFEEGAGSVIQFARLKGATADLEAAPRDGAAGQVVRFPKRGKITE